MTEIFVKLMNKGIKYSEHNKFSYNTTDGATIEDLIGNLHEDYGERFDVYLEDKKTRALRRETIIFVNGKNSVATGGLKTKISKGDLIVFMIAAVGG
ncbi:MAG: MoaD/ThiS family protein [Candidatus Thorarchaeota archaeon]|nr:MoaD/ThiS family protein [Candidatus Thorarchaeota archaeon]MCK5389544.1 MoaD/ThiS family protein [Candidatus Thorarchaeota archaeon]